MPATPGSTAWPPSRPSVPTSRATRVTSDANDRSWSTMVLVASLSSRISPRTSTVIFFDRSPLATPMVTSAMLRTCAVRLPAIWLTESRRSRHTPDTPWTCACPPSLPSVPTSRATRVTSEVNTASCWIIVLTSLAERRNSPLSGRPSTSSSMDSARSPLATAPMVRAISVVGRTRSSMSVLTASACAAHPPTAPGSDMRCFSRPLLADRLREPGDLLRHALLVRNGLVERRGQCGVDPRPMGGQPDREIAVAKRLHRREDAARLRFRGFLGPDPKLCRRERPLPRATVTPGEPRRDRVLTSFMGSPSS